MAHTNVNQGGATFTYVKTIADRTKEAREALGLNQVQLAELAKVSPGTIGNIEAGTRKNPRELLAIAGALKVHPEWLKSGKGPRSLDEPDATSAYSERVTLSAMEHDLIRALRKLPDQDQDNIVKDVMHRAEIIEQLVQRVLAQRGIPVTGYVTAARAAETLPPPPAAPDIVQTGPDGTLIYEAKAWNGQERRANPEYWRSERAEARDELVPSPLKRRAEDWPDEPPAAERQR